MKAIIDNVKGFRTAHDVRRLRVCQGCHGLGSTGQMIQLADDHWHTRCFRVRQGFKAVLALPLAQRDKFRMCDLTLREMQRLIDTR